jgi:hypothetical protein
MSISAHPPNSRISAVFRGERRLQRALGTERRTMPADQFGHIEHLADWRPDLRTRILAANQVTIDELIDGVMSDERFLALIGEAATGKTTVASALREELTARSVWVSQIGKAESSEISPRQIVAEVLGVPLANLSATHVESFIRVMTQRKLPGPRFVLIIDDAELLRSDAIGCLRLLASLAAAAAVQIVFVGRPQFWQVLGHAASPDGNGLIRRHWELARLDAGGTEAATAPCPRATGSTHDQTSAEAATSADYALETASEAVAKFWRSLQEHPVLVREEAVRRPGRFVGLAIGAVVMLVIGSLAAAFWL